MHVFRETFRSIANAGSIQKIGCLYMRQDFFPTAFDLEIQNRRQKIVARTNFFTYKWNRHIRSMKTYAVFISHISFYGEFLLIYIYTISATCHVCTILKIMSKFSLSFKMWIPFLAIFFHATLLFLCSCMIQTVDD